MARAPDEQMNKARELYLSGKKLAEIAAELNKPEGTIRRWKSSQKWESERSEGKANVLSERSAEKANVLSERSETETSWIDIENEYVTDIRKKACTLAELAKKYSVPEKTIQEHCKAEDWVKKRDEYRKTTGEHIRARVMEEDVNRILKLIRITDTATEKAEQALLQLENYVVSNKKKVKKIEYKDSNPAGKPAQETVEEAEEIRTVKGPIDRQGLLFVTNALKNIREIYKLETGETGEETKYTGIPATMIAPAFAKTLFEIEQNNYLEYVLPGGRGSAKSSFLSLIILDIMEKDENIHACIMRQVADTLRTSVYQQMLWAIQALGLEEEYHATVSPLEITKKSTGQKIYFSGADDPDKIKSIKVPFGYIGIAWFEELDQFLGEDAVRNIEQSVIRGGDTAYIFKSFNPPKTANNWANQYIKIPKKNQLVVHSTYLDVPPKWLGKPFLEEAEHIKETNPAAYENEYLGVANGSGGNVFDNVVIREITDEEIKEFDNILNGVDWGWYPDKYAFVRVHYDPARLRLYIWQEYTCNKTPNRQTADILMELGLTGNDLITCDSAEKKSVADYKSYGLLARPAEKGPGSREYSYKWLQSLVEIVIDNVRCPVAAEEFLKKEYERDKDGNVISGYPDGDDHVIDAVRYATNTIWKRRGE